jgi:hypothetical protein
MKSEKPEKPERIIVGWREWVSLPDLNLHHIKAKIDTGARTSALHAFSVKGYTRKGVHRVKFLIHPYQNRKDVVKECDARIVDQRMVSDSGGHKERRYVISTTLVMGNEAWDIEMTLTDRDTMKFRMLLGRTAMKKKIIVDPGHSFLVGKKPHKKVKP